MLSSRLIPNGSSPADILISILISTIFHVRRDSSCDERRNSHRGELLSGKDRSRIRPNGRMHVVVELGRPVSRVRKIQQAPNLRDIVLREFKYRRAIDIVSVPTSSVERTVTLTVREGIRVYMCVCATRSVFMYVAFAFYIFLRPGATWPRAVFFRLNLYRDIRFFRSLFDFIPLHKYDTRYMNRTLYIRC